MIKYNKLQGVTLSDQHGVAPTDPPRHRRVWPGYLVRFRKKVIWLHKGFESSSPGWKSCDDPPDVLPSDIRQSDSLTSAHVVLQFKVSVAEISKSCFVSMIMKVIKSETLS